MKEFQIPYMEYKLKLKTKVAAQNGHIRVDVTLLCIKVHSKMKKKISAAFSLQMSYNGRFTHVHVESIRCLIRVTLARHFCVPPV